MPASPQWRFDRFQLDPDHACVWCEVQAIVLPPKAFAVLHYLVTHPHRLVTKDELLDAVWPNTAVSDAVVRVAIGAVRKVLGDTAQTPRFIATVPRRGYRFLAPVEEQTDVAPGAVPVPAGSVPPVAPQLLVGRPAVATAALPQAPPAGPSRPHGVLPTEPLPPLEAERRQLTVLCCELVDAATLAGHLDPEDLREVVRAYQQSCAAVIHRYDGYLAQYLESGLVVYFGYPLAHEDDAQRAVRTGLGMLHALDALHARLPLPPGDRVAVRLGIHTGLVVVGHVGAGARQAPLALGEPPNLAAYLQELAAPNTLVISAATWQLLRGFFACQALGPVCLPGRAQPLVVYQVLAETTARSRLEAVGRMGLTPFVGREPEIGMLRERWAQVKAGLGQVVLLSGEAGIGKSRLVQVLTEQVATESQAWLTPCQCVPYYQHTALYPMRDLLERVTLGFEREESPSQKLRKLEGFLVQYGLPLAEAMPLFAALLSLPLAAPYAPLTLAPEQQKQQLLHALVTIFLRIAAQQPVLFVMEDLHWVDSSTLELLSLLVEQGPTARILALFTFRPDFRPPWTGRAHLTQVTLPRLPRQQATEMTDRVAHGKALPAEVVAQVVAKTDGVPLFVEELTKMVLESGLLQEQTDRYELLGTLPALAIPATLHDSLMARLDRLATVKAMAQLGAALGREFAYDLLQAVSLWDEAALRRGLYQLVEAEFLYQQGLPPQATYRFKHALIQDAAYQSLLRSTRQQYHQRIAQVLEARFPEICETQPELLAHHYMDAGLSEQAVGYWHKAGQRAVERSAHVEAIRHLTKGIEVLKTLPETPECARQELDVQTTLGQALMATKGYAAPAVEQAYTRARELGQQVGETRQLFPVLWGLWVFYVVRAEYKRARELAEQLLSLAQSVHTPAFLLEAHRALGITLSYLGEAAPAREHLERGIALYNPQQHRSHAFLYAIDPGVGCLSYAARVLWYLGYPDQALKSMHAALILARELAYPLGLACALELAAEFHQFRREAQQAQEQAEDVILLATEQGFPFWVAWGTMLQGWALVKQGQGMERIGQIRQGLAAYLATGAELGRSYYLVLLAEAYGTIGQPEEGLGVLREAIAVVDKTGERWWEAELYRLKGELLQAAERGDEAEACFWQALTIARRQEAKSLELRAAMSLARLWQQQGKRAEAHALLAPVYGWFTEGFDTTDLQEARALLDALT